MTGTSIVMQIGGGQLNISLYPWYQNLCDASIFLHAKPNFREKMKKTQFSGQILTFLYGPSLPKYKDVFNNFLHDQTSLVID